MSRLHITVSNAEFYDVLKGDAETGSTSWTVNKHVQPGDVMLLYICAPVSAIVARATITDWPELQDHPSSVWFGHWMVDMEDLKMLNEPVTRAILRERFSSWGYWRQPRNSIVVPEAFAPELGKLIESMSK